MSVLVPGISCCVFAGMTLLSNASGALPFNKLHEMSPGHLRVPETC